MSSNQEPHLFLLYETYFVKQFMVLIIFKLKIKNLYSFTESSLKIDSDSKNDLSERKYIFRIIHFNHDELAVIHIKCLSF